MNNQSPEKLALRKAADLVGGQAAMANLLGYQDRRNVWPWFATRRAIPAEHCPALERATAGAVRCEDLRPDVDWAVLRAASPGAPAGAAAAGVNHAE
jgi:DNA-binding transcriptional regulator YdaS (Cro superfamily)